MAEATSSIADLTAENVALRRELERYRSIVHQLNTGVYIYELEDRDDDYTLRMLDANPAVALLTGVPTTDQIGKTLDENFPGLREQGIPQAYARVVTSGESIESEAVYGDERVVTAAFAIRAVPLPGTEVAVFFDNITLRKQTELALKQLNAELEQRVAERTAELQRSQNLLCHVLDYAPTAIYIKDLEGRFMLVNQRAANLLGLKTKDMVGKLDSELFPQEHVAQWRVAEQEVVRSGRPVVQEDTVPQPDGIHTFLSSRAPVFDENNQVYAIGGVSTDITERIKDEDELLRTTEALRESQHLLKIIFQHMPVAVILKHAADGRFILWNQSCEHLFGRKAAEVVGKTDYDIFPREQADSFRVKDLEVLQRKRAEEIPEEVVDSATLGRRILRTNKIPILNDEGEPIYLLVICTDLTEAKRAADERTALQAQIIEAQQHALRELSTPLLPLSNKVVLMPIIGAIDSRRASQIMETLLQGVAEHNAEIAIVDITGVQVVDTQVANAFIQAARAVQLLGAQVVITGIRPEVAQTLVQLGVDLQGMLSRGSLQSGVAYSLRMAAQGG
ncbi:MAG: PAS domain S-box protein [Candidatus Viridilinea halotolerans]|uniref:PAS domain S-box protein n=1 Tax=Candidatus Viridilinea halotolerans TaxID=2491704 RepID=A0A426TR84_9CHLR|nr:MAG: PAS domain S-box protein [Candidatus Viridilinea halotolerans]